MLGSGTDDQMAGRKPGTSCRADIIASPVRPGLVAGDLLGDKDVAVARLDRVLLTLNEALGEQSAAVRVWNETHQALAASVLMLSERLRSLDDRLASWPSTGA